MIGVFKANFFSLPSPTTSGTALCPGTTTLPARSAMRYLHCWRCFNLCCSRLFLKWSNPRRPFISRRGPRKIKYCPLPKVWSFRRAFYSLVETAHATNLYFNIIFYSNAISQAIFQVWHIIKQYSGHYPMNSFLWVFRLSVTQWFGIELKNEKKQPI